MINTDYQSHSNYMNFSGGITRKLKRNYFPNEVEVIKVFEKHPQKNGIAGQLPKNWIENLNQTPFKEDKSATIRNIYKQFAKIIKLAENDIKNATENLNQLLKKYGILKGKESYNIKKIDTSESVYTKNGYIIEGNNGAKSLFVKEFKNLDYMSPRRYAIATEHDGKYVEIARALQINNQVKNKHMMHTYWSDTKNGYMVSEYVKPSTNSNSKIQIKEIYSSEKELVKDLQKKYGFTFEEIKNNKIKIGYDYENKFYSYPEEIILFNYFSTILGKKKLIPYDLMYNDNNYIITSNVNGENLIKLIDFGKIKKDLYS